MPATVVTVPQLSLVAAKQKAYIDAKDEDLKGRIDAAKEAAASDASQQVADMADSLNRSIENSSKEILGKVEEQRVKHIEDQQKTETDLERIRRNADTLKETVNNLDIPTAATADDIAPVLAIFETAASEPEAEA